MFCSHCGKESAPDVHFCSNCGRALAVQFVQQPVADPRYAPQGHAPQMQMYPANRVQNHIRTLGILWLVVGCLRVVGIGWLWFVGREIVPSILGNMIPSFSLGSPLNRLVEGGLAFASVLIVLQAALAFFAGWGLLERQSWSRIVAIIAGILSLWHIPFGTALGVYTLWVLLPASSEAEFRHLARPSAI
ncbi:MAG TPA: zinc ribbon domain-containing protein [Candidatus Acidoferrales bacterium]|nr:zinc ribbon domain-containing protein [Candidatus Acidoferrales bacterium]